MLWKNACAHLRRERLNSELSVSIHLIEHPSRRDKPRSRLAISLDVKRTHLEPDIFAIFAKLKITRNVYVPQCCARQHVFPRQKWASHGLPRRYKKHAF